MDIFNNQLLQGGLILGGLTTLLYSLKTLGAKLLVKIKERVVFRVIVYDYDELFYVLEDYIARQHPGKLRSLEASYDKTRRWVEGVDKEERSKERRVNFKQEPNIFIIKYKGKRLLFEKTKKELEHATDLRMALSFHYDISTWRGKQVLQEFLQELTDEYNNSLRSNKLSIYSAVSDGWRLVGKRTVKPIDEVILKQETKDFLVSDLDKWKGSQDWYKNLNIVWKRSFCLWGPPGTGKTTTAQAIAAYLNKDICSLNLSSVMSDQALVNVFSELRENTLLLIEDIDCIFKGRVPINKDIKVTFSCLLNCLDGVISKEGVVTVITTNHLEHLDPALIRPGRMDVTLELPLATTPEINQYLSLFYQEPIKLGQEITIGMSKVQEICLRNRDNPHKAICEIIN